MQSKLGRQVNKLKEINSNCWKKNFFPQYHFNLVKNTLFLGFKFKTIVI